MTGQELCPRCNLGIEPRPRGEAGTISTCESCGLRTEWRIDGSDSTDTIQWVETVETIIDNLQYLTWNARSPGIDFADALHGMYRCIDEAIDQYRRNLTCEEYRQEIRRKYARK